VRAPSIFAGAVLALLGLCHAAPENPRGPVAANWEDAHARLVPVETARRATAGKLSIDGKLVTGYQGWFAAAGDGSGMGWKHYGDQDLRPGRCTFEMWPDMSEMDEDEKYPSPFQQADGSVAMLFSSYHPKTVDRHFSWMKEFGIDAAMLQRFGVGLKSPRSYDFNTAVMQNVRHAAAKNGRGWAMMYDLSGMGGEELNPIITADWKRLVRQAAITEDAGYLHFQGKPLVAIWGVGFNDGRKYGIDECRQLLDFLQNDPEYGGNAVMLGIPYYWREQNRDSIADADFHALLKQADLLSPWSVGRYRGSERVAGHAGPVLAGDLEWCSQHGRAYLPVIFPGFSWRNLERFRGRDAPFNQIDREGGKFLWRQAVEAKRAGASMIYLAMFDELDEATAIMKVTNDPPIGESDFLTYGDHPPDHYLWLAGKIRSMLQDGNPPAEEVPSR
jgi:hypothetical protein